MTRVTLVVCVVYEPADLPQHLTPADAREHFAERICDALTWIEGVTRVTASVTAEE